MCCVEACIVCALKFVCKGVGIVDMVFTFGSERHVLQARYYPYYSYCRMAWDGIIKEQLDSRHKPCNFVQMVTFNAATKHLA